MYSVYWVDYVLMRMFISTGFLNISHHLYDFVASTDLLYSLMDTSCLHGSFMERVLAITQVSQEWRSTVHITSQSG